MEDWLNKADESITVVLTYGMYSGDQLDCNTLSVNLMFSERESEQLPWILKYKELHPLEFEDFTDMTEPNQQ